MKHTPSQEQAIQAKGNVLVVAGAGTGKTRTLIDRCMTQLLDPKENVTLLEILMVTFTEAAATEMRERIAQRLEAALGNDPQNPELQEKLAHIDAASIGTLHSFCLNLIRQQFHLLALDPQARVLDTEETSTLEQQSLDELLEQHFEGKDEFSESVRRYVIEFENGWDKGLRDWIIKIHRFSQTMVNPEGWIHRQIQSLVCETPDLWSDWLVEEMKHWAKEWGPILSGLPEENTNAKTCLAILETFKASDHSLPSLASCVQGLTERDQKDCWPPRCKTRHRDPIQKLLNDAAFLATLCPSESDTHDPLKEDWTWYRERTRILLELTRAFSELFQSKKLERGGLDFSDLEQHTLTLLWNRKDKKTTDLAGSIQQQFKFVYVDEYQDINAAQDCILTAISGTGNKANRFLVGDVKQSIYGFRLASPQYFIDYEKAWQQSVNQESRQVIYLQDNFRSHPGILHFVNACFSQLMADSQGSQAYDQKAHLLFGDPENRGKFRDTEQSSVECRFILKSSNKTEPDTIESDDLTDAEKEAWATALRFKALKEGGHLIFDTQTDSFRPVEWRDMAILIRSVRSKADIYSRTFSQLGIPLEVPRSGMLERTEITDLISLLMLLDNPRQDVPLLAVLRSPIVRMTDDELALLRIGSRRSNLWKALNHFHETSPEDLLPASLKQHPKITTAKRKSQKFLHQFRQWRQSGRHLNLSRRLELILNETLYIEQLTANINGGAEAITHVQQLLHMARQFDHYQQQGLNRFLKSMENKRELEAEFDLGTSEDGQTVRLMSIHKSKGLEFPVVAIAGLGGVFNFQDVQQTWLLDESIGLAGMIQPPGARPRYPSLPLWISRRKRKSENLREEMRLLYVAFTRAKDLLILVGSATEKRMKKWTQDQENQETEIPTSHARCAMDWLVPWLTRLWDNPDWWSIPTGSAAGVDWNVFNESPVEALEIKEPQPHLIDDTKQTPSWYNRWSHLSNWEYPHLDASSHPAKATVTMLRKRHQSEASATESATWFGEKQLPLSEKSRLSSGGLSASEKGIIHHQFLQWLELKNEMTLEHLAIERDQMIESGNLDPRAVIALDLQSIADFWHTDIGQTILNHHDQVHREMPFTARFGLSELKDIGLAHQINQTDENDFVIIQGIVDVAILGDESIQILDYKTDLIDEQSLTSRLDKHRSQLELYAEALQRIYQRPVTHKWLHFLTLKQTIEIS